MTRKQWNVHEAKTHLSALLERALNGDEVVIARAGRPIAKLVAYDDRDDTPRRPGSWRGRVRLADDFDDLPPELGSAFAGDTDE
jgi:prevent-host-death family protein